jgi:preprotein translocase subunit SecG
MATALMVLQAIVAVLLIISVLLQFGKGAEAGLLTQAGSETVMSNSTRGNIMTKITAVLAVIFLVNSILLARTQDSKFNKSLLDTEAPVARPLNNDAAEAAAQPATTPAATTTAPTTEAAAPTATAPATTPAAGTTTTK